MWVSVCMRKQQCVSQWQLEAESELLALTFGTCTEYKVRNLHEHERTTCDAATEQKMESTSQKMLPELICKKQIPETRLFSERSVGGLGVSLSRGRPRTPFRSWAPPAVKK